MADKGAKHFCSWAQRGLWGGGGGSGVGMGADPSTTSGDCSMPPKCLVTEPGDQHIKTDRPVSCSHWSSLEYTPAQIHSRCDYILNYVLGH